MCTQGTIIEVNALSLVLPMLIGSINASILPFSLQKDCWHGQVSYSNPFLYCPLILHIIFDIVPSFVQVSLAIAFCLLAVAVAVEVLFVCVCYH